jgi:phytoene dehydrogenase-like protein
VIVGAGPAGLRAGAIAAARGHHVVVHERDSEPGGHLREIAWLPTRGGWTRAVDDMVAELERYGGALRLGSDVSEETLQDDSSDVILIAAGSEWDSTGASANRPERDGIPVTENGRMLGLGAALRTTQSDPSALGRRVLIVDESGDYAPLGLAEALAAAGVLITIVTPAPSIGAAAAALLETAHVLPRLRSLGVELMIDCDVASVRGTSVELADVWGGAATLLHGIDSVVLAMGRTPRDELLHRLRGRDKDVRRIGDALTPRSTVAVIHEAEMVARVL